ncbi:MAG: tRNA (adenosine(37)-N6)-threonylcarbamoyltransferase complex ATPase subunit type 1 TsaE [Clostridiales bacterium]|nr:tRNA (adenosine(37)-N6)-threonylcarbamoyltransferase complex ATPase subunit type 1 TsaE [Clostridiales bacterium]
MEQVKITTSEEETNILASQLASKLLPGAIVLLNGDMGAGKSVFARGIIQSLGYKGAVTSPTFTLMNEYPTEPVVYHFDLYRLKSYDQLYDIGYDEYIYSDGISLIEWSEKMEHLLPENYVEIIIEKIDPTTRKITVIPDDNNEMIS